MTPYKRLGFAYCPTHIVFVDKKGKITIKIYGEGIWGRVLPKFHWSDLPLPG